MRRGPLLLALLLLPAPVTPGATQPLSGPVRVLRVWDGDTILVSPSGAKKPEEKVRIIGIDTPEIGSRDRPAEAGARDAQARVENWIQGRAVRLTLEPRNARDGHRDRYDRLLAYVDDGRGGDLGLTLVREGLARVYRSYTFERRRAYEAAESEARKNRRGIWATSAAAAYPARRDGGTPGFLVRHEGGDLWAVCAAGRARTGVAGAELASVLRRLAGMARAQRGAALARELERNGFEAVGSCGSTVE